MKKRIYLAVLTLLMAVLPAANASAATVARWDFNETSLAHPDYSGNGLTATSGNEVKSTVISGTNRAIHTDWISDIMTSTHPGRLTRVANSLPNADLLNPKTGNYAITVRFKNTQSYGNMIQKGQSGTRGGYFKWEMPSGQVTCLFRDANGVNLVVKTPADQNLKNQWATVKCSLIRGTNGTARSELALNGVTTARAGFKTFGSISNSTDITMMGKGNCNQSSVTCDYFAGDFDYVELTN